jgi:hypothetical protein
MWLGTDATVEFHYRFTGFVVWIRLVDGGVEIVEGQVVPRRMLRRASKKRR